MVLRFPKLKIFQQWWGIPLLVFALAIILPGIFFYAHPVSADFSPITGLVWYTLSNIFQWLSGFATDILLWLIGLLIYVSGYNNFINAKVVQVGWPLVRDVANMFYILVMLVIAFATMLKIEKYSMKALLPRLILTAILVNFSKTIIGLIIDFGQVIMLTFVNGYAATAGGNFVQMFGLKAMTELRSDKSVVDSPAQLSVLASFFLAFICISISMIVVGIFVVVLLARIIVLWILIVLSPIAFLLGTFPKGQDYYGKWWKELINNVISGPIVAFFLWLSLAVFGGGNMGSAELKAGNAVPDKPSGEAAQYAANLGLSQAGALDNLTTFAVSIAMLLMGLSQINELGVVGAGLASGAMSTMKSVATKAIKRAVVPAALIAGGAGIPMALAKMSIMKGGMDIAAKMPVIGKTMTGFRKAATEYVGESGKLEQKFGIPVAGMIAKIPASVTSGLLSAAVLGTGAAAGAIGRKEKVYGALQRQGAGLKAVGEEIEAGTEKNTLLSRFGRAVGVGHAARLAARFGGAVQKRGEKLEDMKDDQGRPAGIGTAALKGLVGGFHFQFRSLNSAQSRAVLSVAAAERKEAREADAHVKEEEHHNVVDHAFRDPAFNDAVDAQFVYANRMRAVEFTPVRKIAEKRDPEGFRTMVEELPAFADKLGVGDDARKRLRDFKIKNPRYKSIENKYDAFGNIVGETEMQEHVNDMTPGNMKNVSVDDLRNPNFAILVNGQSDLTADGRLSKKQREALDEGLRGTPLEPKPFRSPPPPPVRAPRPPRGGRRGAAPPPDDEEPPEDEGGPPPFGGGGGAFFLAAKIPGAISAGKRFFARRPITPEEFDDYSPEEKAQRLAYTNNADEVEEHLGYQRSTGNFANPEAPNIIGAAVRQSGADNGQMPEWAKNLKAEAVFSTTPDLKIAGLTQMTQALVKNATISQILALRTRGMSEDQKKLAAALHLAMIGRLESEGNESGVAELREKLETRAYTPIREQAIKIQAEIRDSGGLMAPVSLE